MLAAIRAIDPTASRVAAVRWGEFEAARPLFDAVTAGKIDHFLHTSGELCFFITFGMLILFLAVYYFEFKSVRK